MNNNYIPNTSAIPNILFDYWMDKLSPAEFKVLMCIARKAQDPARISIEQIEKVTGLSRKIVFKSVEALIGHRLIEIKKDIIEKVPSYCLAQTRIL